MQLHFYQYAIGGQWRFFESYFENETMFRNVEVLIYVFDVDSDLTNEQNPMMNPINLFMGGLVNLAHCALLL